MSLRRSAPLFAALLALSACESLGLSTQSTYDNRQKDELYRHGSILSEQGGVALFGGSEPRANTEGAGLGVNGFLWRATLDTIAFMPIATADPFGGVITTDWFSPAGNGDDRIKLNVFILDRELRADGVKVSVFRQTRDAGGQWADAAPAPTTASQLEETILTRARQMRLAQKAGG
jgi:hypothetical protein